MRGVVKTDPPTPDPDSAPAPAPLAFRTVPPGRAWRWVAAGTRDLLTAPAASLAHGLVVTLGGVAIVVLGWQALALLAGAFTGFLLVAPMLATPLHALSRRIEQGQATGLIDIAPVGVRLAPPLLRIGAALAAVGTVWVLLSIATLAGMTRGPVEGLGSFLAPAVWRAAASGTQGHLFVMWLLAGGLVAALVFAASAVSIPLLVDREIGARQAVLASIEAVARNPGAMGVWTLLILAGTAFGTATVIGLVVVWPVLGHAAWHAYRDLVDAQALPERAL